MFHVVVQSAPLIFFSAVSRHAVAAYLWFDTCGVAYTCGCCKQIPCMFCKTVEWKTKLDYDHFVEVRCGSARTSRFSAANLSHTRIGKVDEVHA